MQQETLHDPSAERAVLAGVFQFGNDAYLDIMDIVNESCFSGDNSIVWSCLSKVLEDSDKVDDASFISAAYAMGIPDHFTNDSEKLYILSLKELPIKCENVRKHAIRIKKLQFTRNLKKRLSVAQEEILEVTGSESIDEIINIAERAILDLSVGIEIEDTGPKLLGEDINDFIEALQERDGGIVGISTGFPRLDKALGGGIRRKTVNLFAARLKVGKSMLADHLALHACKNLGIPILMLDTEMSEEDHKIRILSSLSQLESNDLEVGNFNPAALVKASTILQTIPYHYVSVAGRPFEEILSVCRRWLLKEVGFDEEGRANDCLIVYDYFKLISAEHMENMAEFQALGFQISKMHDFCVKYDCPVVSFVQTNRDGINGEDTSIIANSDRLAQIATSVCLLKTKTAEEMAEETGLGNRKMITLATRHGGGLEEGDYIHMNLDGARATLTEIMTRNEARAQPAQEEGFEDEDET